MDSVSQRTNLILSKLNNPIVKEFVQNQTGACKSNIETVEVQQTENSSINEDIAEVYSNSSLFSDYSVEDPHYVPSESSEVSDNVEPPVLLPTRKRKVTPKAKVGRKRVRNPDEWIDNKAKRNLNNGTEHENRTGKLIPAREMAASCKENCRYKCRNKLNEEVRKLIFDGFWKLGDHTRQWDFIVRCVKQLEKKQLTVKNGDSRRAFSREYHFTVANNEYKICKTMFLNTLGISETFITTALKKNRDGGMVDMDMRGKHVVRVNKRPEAVIENIRKHINLFPAVPSHYTRKNSQRKFLEGNLNIAKMYRLYLEYAEDLKWDAIATQRQYRDIFNSEYNLAFYKPKKDQCGTCCAYNNTDAGNRTDKMEEEYNVHILNKTAARNQKDADKELSLNDKSVRTVCFDLQKVLVTPQSDVSDFYYKSKLATYNFTIYDLGNNKGYCYVWYEQLSKRGPNEISSCLWNFLKNIKDEGIRKVILYSDNCGGQNRNRFIFSMFAFASASFKLEITHRFLEKGHTQNEGDSMHAVIENARKRHSAIYTPDQWVSLIKMSKVTGKPYQVKEMSQEDFYSFKVMVQKQNWKIDTSGNVVKISQIRDIYFDPTKPNAVFFAYNFGDDYKELNLQKNLRQNQDNTLPQLYKNLLPIDKKKLDGLLMLCNTNRIPSMYHGFYNSLMPAKEVEDYSAELTDQEIDSE